MPGLAGAVNVHTGTCKKTPRCLAQPGNDQTGNGGLVRKFYRNQTAAAKQEAVF